MKKIVEYWLSLFVMTVTSVMLTRCINPDRYSMRRPSSDIPYGVHTLDVTSITLTSAVCGGSIDWQGQAPVSSRGVFWSTTSNPSVDGNKTSEGSGSRPFTSNITGLTANTKYYVRAYATNSYGTAYGEIKQFTTAPEVPLVTTSLIIYFTNTSAKAEGRVTSPGLTPVAERGVFWSTSQDPEKTGTKVQVGADTGKFSTDLIGLNPNTKYYIKTYATNSLGTSFGEQISFVTRTGKITDIEGNIYYTQTIGNQLWMAENLKTTKYADGSSISLANTVLMWKALSLTSKAYCWYDDSIKNKDIYGALYNWAAAMNLSAGSSSNPSGVQGVCPTGWHLPSQAEWKELETFLGGSNNAQGKMKEPGTTHWESPNTGATNESGFSALPGGYRGEYGTFGGYDQKIGTAGSWWSTTEFFSTSYPEGIVYAYNITTNNSPNFSLGSLKRNGYSVRCLIDK